MSGEILIYTDGACSGNPGAGGWAAIVGLPDDDYGYFYELGGSVENTTNNRMELFAVIKGIEHLSNLPDLKKNEHKIHVYSDSSYVVNAMTSWIKGWVRKGWINSQNKPVKNKELWIKLLNITKQDKIFYHHVKGHSGHSWNERCDEIAYKFSQNIPVELKSGKIKLPAKTESLKTKKEYHGNINSYPVYIVRFINNKVKFVYTWSECENLVKCVSGVKYKKCKTLQQANEFLNLT